MPRDRGRPTRVAWGALIACTSGAIAASCGPSVRPPEPPAAPEPVTRTELTPPVATGVRNVVLGEMCPQGAGGRPAVAPLVMRGVGWNASASEVVDTVERGSVPRFVVFGADGKMAGAFDTLGVVDIAPQQSVATGTYAGSAPCTGEAPTSQQSGTIATRVEVAGCAQATGGCGLAVGEITRPDDPPGSLAFPTGGACVAGDQLVDVDGDGHAEAFPLAGILDGIRGPAAEWTATRGAATTCTPTFQLYGLKLAAAPEKGKVDPKSVVGVDVLGVLDLDGDGRREVVLALRFATVRSVVVYSASATPERLELAGEATSFTR